MTAPLQWVVRKPVSHRRLVCHFGSGTGSCPHPGTGKHWSVLCRCKLTLPDLELHPDGNMKYACLYILLPSTHSSILGDMSSYIVAHANGLSFLLLISFYCRNKPQFIHSFADEHWDCFQFFLILEVRLLWTFFFFFLTKCWGRNYAAQILQEKKGKKCRNRPEVPDGAFCHWKHPWCHFPTFPRHLGHICG